MVPILFLSNNETDIFVPSEIVDVSAACVDIWILVSRVDTKTHQHQQFGVKIIILLWRIKCLQTVHQ